LKRKQKLYFRVPTVKNKASAVFFLPGKRRLSIEGEEALKSKKQRNEGIYYKRTQWKRTKNLK